MTHSELKAALFPIALREVRNGEFQCSDRTATFHSERVARGVASAAAADVILRGYTLMLPMIDVRRALREAKQAA